MIIKKGDNVTILTGKCKGMTGKVIRALPRESKVIVEGINMLKRHQRPRKEGQKGTIVDKAMPIHVSNVALASDASIKNQAPVKKLEKKSVKK
jgi:large subunit ribosomal protein L24